MPTFPRTESELLLLAAEMIEGYTTYPGSFPNADAPPPSDYDLQAVQAPSTTARPERPNGFALLAQLRAQTGQGYFGISASTPLSSMAGRVQATPVSVTPASGAARASIVS